MQMVIWLPSVASVSLLALGLWLARKSIAAYLTKGIEYRFDSKLETVRAELRSKEAEIAALRGGTLTALASRQIALDKRRLEAVDELWSAVTALGPAKAISSWVSVMKFDAVADEASKNPQFREAFKIMGSAADPSKFDTASSARARPFVSPMAWAIFSACQAIAVLAVMKLEVIKSGIAAKLTDREAVARLVKAALPHRADYIDSAGDSSYHYLLDELEQRLLDEFQKMLAGVESDKASLERAAEILKLSNDLSATAKHGNAPI